jgi:hypothetical protein
MFDDSDLFLKDVQRIPGDNTGQFCLDGDVSHRALVCPVPHAVKYSCTEFCIMCSIVPAPADPNHEFLYCSYVGKPIALIHPPDPE